MHVAPEIHRGRGLVGVSPARLPGAARGSAPVSLHAFATTATMNGGG